jgi:hypothetical protein
MEGWWSGSSGRTSAYHQWRTEQVGTRSQKDVVMVEETQQELWELGTSSRWLEGEVT